MKTDNTTHPVIICGYPKSGTTLFCSLLDGHPELMVIPEEFPFFKAYNRPNMKELLLEKKCFSAYDVGEITHGSGYRDYSDIDFPLMKDKVEQLLASTSDQRAIYAGCIDILFHFFGTEGSKYWVEKTPLNERHYAIFKKWYGDGVHFLHIVRDPRDVFSSYGKRRKELTLEKFVKQWAFSTELGTRLAERDDKYVMFRYEDLVSNPEKTLGSLCEKLGIEFTKSLLVPTKNNTPWGGNSMHGKQFNRISASQVGVHKDKVPAEDVRRIEAALSRWMDGFGYREKLPGMGKNIARKNVLLWRVLNRISYDFYLRTFRFLNKRIEYIAL